MSQEHAHNGDHDHGDAHEHVVPLWMLAGVLGILMVLTVVTVAASKAELGEIALFVAMVIAVIKAAFVVLFFMHLWWDSRFNSLCLIGAMAFVALLICFMVMDTGEFKPKIQSHVDAHGPAQGMKPGATPVPPPNGSVKQAAAPAAPAPAAPAQ